jgi:gliding motility-associated-like protein
MKKVLLILTLMLSTMAIAQFSKRHYIPPIGHSSNQEPEAQFLYISAPSVTPVNFKLFQLGSTTISGTVSRNNPYVLNLGTGEGTQIMMEYNNISSVRSNKGFIIEAEDVVYASVRVIASNGNHAGSILSKGSAALGNRFRIGAFLNQLTQNYSQNYLTFISVLATENNTAVNFSNIATGVVLVNNATAGNNPGIINLNSGESYVLAVQGPTNANRDGLIGSLVTSDKPIVVNCGSFAGSNGELSNLDLGFDQIVPAERTGSEFIFIKSNGQTNVERVLLIADQDNTEVYTNGNPTPITTLNAGQYQTFSGAQFSANSNLYVSTSKPVFVYQSISNEVSQNDQRNQQMFFVPPLSCQTPKIIDNIPEIEKIGSTIFIGKVTIVTETAATLTFKINNVDYALTSLPANVTVNGPNNVIGNTAYETYTIQGLTGNVSVFSTGQLYLASYGSANAATFGGYYSGFTFKPDIDFTNLSTTQSDCIPNVSLSVNTINGFDTFQWYLNGAAIPMATNSSYQPTQAGNYRVEASISSCTAIAPLSSDDIPVSDCPLDFDSDGVNDNIDLDTDNDGIANCTESFGNASIAPNNSGNGTISVGLFNSTFTNSITTQGVDPPAANPLVTNTDGSFTTSVPKGRTNKVILNIAFAQETSILLDYPAVITTGDESNGNSTFILKVPVNKTITILNPNNQLLIDTNYDGIFESNVTQFSSFEVRFRFTSTTPLPAGSGTFKFYSNSTSSVTLTQQNLLDRGGNQKATWKLTATCVPKDFDNDGIPDAADLDSDNDGILDSTEALGNTILAINTTDANQDGIYDIFVNGLIPNDFDGDGVPNYLDLDSDNDGVFDVIEAGNTLNATNTNGISVGPNYGLNGLDDGLETFPDSGILAMPTSDLDNDGVKNYLDLDSDGDNCNDVIEAGYLDGDNNGILGNSPVTVNPNGTVISPSGYTVPNSDYSTSAPVTITTQPANVFACEQQGSSVSVVAPNINTHQWQISTDNGVTWTDLTNNATYSGVTTDTLVFSNVLPTMSGYQYRVFLNRLGNTCGLFSAASTLAIYQKPIVNSPLTLVQCDLDTDGISDVNLTQKNPNISSNSAVETFTFYTSAAAAETVDTNFLIANPIAYNTSNTTVYVRVTNANGCYRVATLNIIVSATQIPTSFQIPDNIECDDFIDSVNDDRDGISEFDFSANTALILSQITAPGTYTVSYYRSQADFNAENDANGNSLAIPASELSAYRNIGYPNQQTIYARVENDLTNDCFGNVRFNLVVEALPTIGIVGVNNIIRECDDDQDGSYTFNTSNLEATILQGQTNKTITYNDQNGNAIASPFPPTYTVTGNDIISVRITNNTNQMCFEEGTFEFIVDDLPQAFAIPNNQFSLCDDETVNPQNQDGILTFNTATLESDILQGQTGMVVTYTAQNGTILPSPFPSTFTTTTQNVTVRVTNPINPTCFAEKVVQFTIRPLPFINSNTDGLDDTQICLNFPNNKKRLNAGITNGTSPSTYTYQWFLNGVTTGQTSYFIDINVPGTYEVLVTNSSSCSVTRTIEVSSSEIATITNFDISDLVESNTVIVNVTGSGDYVYSIQNIYGPYQTSNIFENVPIGFHTVYVKDLKECGISEQLISVLGIPKYFTPNGDGINDSWNIAGVNSQFYKNSIVEIYDRYGKLIKVINGNEQGWDGRYNGSELPSDDYWYVAKIDDGRMLKGHFSLKR